MSNCLKLTNNIDVSNGKYIIEQNYSSTSFDVYDNSNSNPDYYKILNVPKEYPLGFYIDGCNNLTTNIYNDIRSIIKYESDITDNIKIYVSRGNDLSFNNGDYFRFYDKSFNLLNISQTTISTNNFLLTASADNFYFMKGVSYEFISAFDFSSSSPFGISGSTFSNALTLTEISQNQILYINNYSNVDNSDNKIYYYDLSKQDISGDLEFLIDSSGINYYYGNVKFQIMNSFPSDVSLSIKSYPKYNLSLSDISNKSLFKYNNDCNYVIQGYDFNQYSLKNNNSECLTRISRADICLNETKVFYEFNKETHNNLIKPRLKSGELSYNDLKYGLYDGSYVIFDICENYPITISSEYITIEENYIYSKKYANYSNIVQNLSGVNEIYKKYDYYYGAIQFTLNPDTPLNNDFSFDLFILDKSKNNISIDSSNTLIYTDFCQGICGETNFKTDLDIKDFTFKLKNQATIIFNDASFSSIANQYKLNKYSEYIELTEPYVISDRFGHTNLENLFDISLVISSAPTDMSSTELISNNFNNSFVITYNFTYFDLSIVQRSRFVTIIDDVFIEFSESIQTKLFKNQTQFTDIIEISTNYFDESYNFFNDIEVYIKPNSYEKIYLPFEITISGNQVTQNDNLQSITTQKDISIVSYNTNLLNNDYKNINFNSSNYYLTDKIQYIQNIQNTSGLSNISINTTYLDPFKIQDIKNYSVEKNKFFNDISCIFTNSNNINDGSGSEIIIKGTNNKLFDDLLDNTDNYPLIIYDISNNLQINNNNYTNTIYLHASNNEYPDDVDISFILTFKNENNIDKFKFEAIANKDLSQNINYIDFSYSSGDKFTISGEFFKNDFFKNNNHLIKQNNELNLLDLSNNGNYEFKIDVKGLETGDFIYNELSNNYGINRTNFNLSKIININVIDNQAPDLYFANPDKTRKGTINDFIIPYSISFDILNGILFLNEKTANIENYKDENPNKPIIVYKDNSIYDISLNNDDVSYTLFYPSNIKNNITFIEISDNTQDGSAIIVYKVKDLSDNISNDISLTIFFKNIPYLTICGEAVIYWDVNDKYYDQGLNISGNFFTGISSEVSINEPSSNTFLQIFNTTSYDINFSTDFSSSKLGTYEISYNVKFNVSTDENDIATLRRTINVVDRKKPFVRLFDFSGTDFLTLDLSSGLSTSISNEIFNEPSYNNYKIDNSNNYIIDFSLTYLSSFHDLSRIIHAFDLCDNYTKVGTNTDDFSTNIILNISNIAIDFYNSDFDVKFNTNDLSYNTYNYLDDNSFIRVTQGIGTILPPLVFKYQIIDSCDNSFNFSRKVNIVDITKPTIDFSFIGLNNNSYIDNGIVIYDISKIDFSYQAFNYNKNQNQSQSQFLQEISDIIFNVEISDNYTTENIQNNYNVTISSNTIKYTFKNFNDFSNQIQSNDIINLFKTFDNSFELIYDFSDNQYNDASQIRRVNIINEIEPSLNLIANRINISFGDTSVNLNSFFNLSHPRLTNTDLSFELSYNLPRPRITSISNNDVSALIYQFQQDFSKVTFNNDISFFNIATNSTGHDLSSAIINPPININIPFTNFQGFSTITHEAGVYLSDASLINGLTVTNDFDRFYYTLGEGSNDVSYTGSIFDICYIRHVRRPTDIISFNEFQSDPSLIGEYRIKYSLTNQNNYTQEISRNLVIKDTIDPSINLIGNNSDNVNINTVYYEPGITFSDYGSRLNRLDYVINKNGIDFSNTINDFSNQTTGSFKDIILLNIEDTSNASISYTITYTIYDNSDNSSDISRTITFVDLTKLIITPIINYKTNLNSVISFISQELNADFSSNSPINYDISFHYLHSSKTIFYEATTNSTFTKLIDFSNNYSPEESSNLQLFNPIHSIIPNKVNNYLIFFQIFNNNTFENNIETINFNVIDNTKPKLTFEQNSEFTDICNIKLPLLSNSAYRNLTSNINYFNKLEEIYPSFTYKKDSNPNQIIFSIPGIIVNDIVDELTTTLSNESFDTGFIDLYDISVSYYSNKINDYVDASYLLTNDGSYVQKYIIRDSNDNEADISRNINVVPFQPFIEIDYKKDICNNFYKKLYHKRYENYYDLDASGYDFSYNDISYIILDNNFNKNNLGIQIKTYIATNKDDLSGSKDLDIHIVDIDILKKDISLSSIIQDYSLNNPNNINSADYKRYGVYKNNTYNILTDGSSNAFRIINDQSDNNINTIFQDRFLDLSFSHLNNIVNVTSNKPTYIFEKHNYYYGNVSLEINNDFNRLSIEYLDTSGTTQITKTLKDIILYNEYFETQNVNSGLSESIIERPIAENSFNEITITVSNDTLYKTDFSINAFYLDHNNEPIEQRKTLYLPLGKYKFKQKDYTNFYNPIKFSYLPDGHFYDSSSATNKLNIDLCNIGLTSQNNVDFSFSSFNDPSYQKYEYTRGVQHIGLAGFNTSETGDNSNNGCTTLIISPTTPNPLFYYCKNFPKMGGIIYVTTNVVLYKNIINLNGSILTKENDISFANYYEPSYNEISNNLVFLSQHFDISNNNTNIFSKKKHHIIGLTQQNINHNIIFLKDKTSKETNKLIFKKYEDASKNQSLGILNSDFSYISNYKITEDNSANYLYDSSATQLKTDILMYDFHIDTSNNIINSDNSNSYDYDINKIFFNNNELFNYYYYFKKYNLLQEDLISTSFKYRIGEVAFFNPISIKNSEQEINFYDNLFFNNNRIVLEPLFQNKINLNLQVYIDPLSLTNPDQRLVHYNSEKVKYNLSNYQNIIDPSKILFQEYFINILSDISGKYPAIQATDNQSIIFSNGHIELNDYLLDSSYTSGFLETIYDTSSILKNKIYLGFKDNDTSNNLFCGLTQQNIYHNMFIDDEYNIIFHPYRDNTDNNIYELNNINNYKSRASNIQKLKNEKNYLIEVSSNDLYNTLTPFDNSDNIYSKTNVLNKNKYMNQNNGVTTEFKFKTRISYKIYDELDNIDTKLNNLDIRPITLNGNNPDLSNITDIYQSYPYAYDSALQETHSHSFKINLTDHIDRNFYKDRTNLETETGLTYQNIHYSKLYYVIKDISYDSNFNIYDSVNNQNILYDKTKIKILNYLQSLIYIINFKIDYFYEIKFENKQTALNFNPDDYKLIGFTSYQDLTRLISGDFIDTTYSLELPNVSLNQLFATVLYNSKIIVKKYNIFAEIFNYYDFNIEIIEIDNNIYNINNTLKNSIDQINQIDNDIKSVDIQLDNAYNDYFFRGLTGVPDNSFNRYYILDQSLNTASILLNEFDTLLDLMIDFNKYKQEYNQINYELNLRGIIRDEDMSNNDFIDLYKFNDISGFYSALIDNMQKLNGLYLHDISNTYQDIKYITGNYWKVYDFSLNINPEISFNNSGLNAQFFIDLSNSVIKIGDINDFSDTLYNISYDKYDLSLLKYFSDEISNNKRIDISNIEISYNNYYFYISGESYNIDISKNFSYVKQDYYHDNSINTLNGVNDPSGIGFLKEDSYVLNFNRSIYNQSIDEAYDYLTKSFNFDTINYILNGQELVINSFQSNNIVIEFDVYYNSYLYPNKYLDTIVLDMFIPDLTPPTILFKTEVIDISQTSLANDISSIAQLLINDISYIDINSNSNISFDDDISFAYTQVKETSMNYLNNNVDDSSYVNIYIDISQVANATINNNNNIYVYYTIFDNVNNMNIVKRRVNVVDLCLNPIEFYYYASTVKQYINVNGEDKFDLLIKKGEMLTDNLIMENIRAKDTETNEFIDLNNITYTLSDGLAVNQIVTLEPKTYPDVIIYTATGIYNNIGTINRNIRVLEEDAIVSEPEPEKNTHCCYPAVYYKPIQHNYKLGSSNSTAMRMAKFIINN